MPTDKNSEKATAPTPKAPEPLQPAPVETLAIIAETTPAKTEEKPQVDMAAYYKANNYPFCHKCNERLYTDENRQVICSANEAECPSKYAVAAQ